MNDDLETELRHALRRISPSCDLMPNLTAGATRARQTRGWWTLPVAAALAVAAGMPAYHAHQQRKAKDQLVFALRLTAVKLEHAKAHIRIVGTEGLQ